MKIDMKRWISAILLGCFTLAGCGKHEDKWLKDRPKVYRVHGTVRESGKPLAGAVVIFESTSGGSGASAFTDPDGHYQLTTFKDYDGAIEGEFRVSIEKESYVPRKKPAAKAGSEDSTGPLDRVVETDPKYADSQKSGLTATVTPKGPNQFDFDLEPKKK